MPQYALVNTEENGYTDWHNVVLKDYPTAVIHKYTAFCKDTYVAYVGHIDVGLYTLSLAWVLRQDSPPLNEKALAEFTEYLNNKRD